MNLDQRIAECAQHLLRQGYSVRTGRERITINDMDLEWDIYFRPGSSDSVTLVCGGIFKIDSQQSNEIARKLVNEVNNENGRPVLQFSYDGSEVGAVIEARVPDFSAFEKATEDYFIEATACIRLFKDRLGLSSGSQSAVTFDVEGVIYYDGTGHQLGPSRLTIKSDRVVIDDSRGGLHQILLRDIAGVSAPNPVIAPKRLLINVAGTDYVVYCRDKSQMRSIAAEIRTAVAG